MLCQTNRRRQPAGSALMAPYGAGTTAGRSGQAWRRRALAERPLGPGGAIFREELPDDRWMVAAHPGVTTSTQNTRLTPGRRATAIGARGPGAVRACRHAIARGRGPRPVRRARGPV